MVERESKGFREAQLPPRTSYHKKFNEKGGEDIAEFYETMKGAAQMCLSSSLAARCSIGRTPVPHFDGNRRSGDWALVEINRLTRRVIASCDSSRR
jgi:hypothetical protein